jgi:hypothetical protein
MDKLSEFVREQIKNGVKPDELRAHLVSNGWKDSDVDSAIRGNLGKKKRSRIMFVLIGVILVGILTMVLVSIAKNTTPEDVPPGVNNVNSAVVEVKSSPADACLIKEDSIEKDECYKTLLKTEFDCESLEDNIEYTYCIRAYEDANLQGVERVNEEA